MSNPACALVTGAAGFLGPHIVSELARTGSKVIGLDRRSPPKNEPLLQPIAEWHQVALPSPALDELLIRLQPDVLIHAAGPASVPASIADPAPDFDGSVGLSFHLLNSLRGSAPGCRVIFLSSAAVYGNPSRLPVSEDVELRPLSPYGFHKLMGETLFAEFHSVYGLRTCSARIFSAYGPGLRRQVLWDICQKALHQPVVELLGTGQETRDFIHARDVARGIAMLAMRGRFEGEAYNLATGEETPIHRLAESLLAALGQPKPLRFTGTRRRGDPIRWRAELSCISALGFRPQTLLADGIEEYARWVLQQA